MRGKIDTKANLNVAPQIDVHLSYWPIANEMSYLDKELDRAKRSLQRELGI